MQTEKRPSSQGATWGLAILLGIVGVSFQQSVGGFVIGAALGVLLAQIFYLRSRTETLDRQLQELKQRLANISSAPAERAPAAEAAPTPAATPTPQPAAPTPAAPVITRPVPSFETLLSQPMPDAPPEPLPPPEPTAFDRGVAAFVAWLKRGNPLARAGIVILFFGAAFLAKYAADHSMFPIELRFIGLALGALALLIIGWRLREKRAVYGQLLQGGGIAGLYLTVFAATRLYHLLPFTLAFVLLAVVAVASAVLAVAQNA
ncbi:MAG TPA: DUF2339 domain-containing protein, partial [Steroidobacteraceae bacterium]|nr:DUF2339 domain-containing protein [Steroidobacteraceae bacterium]